MANAFTIQDAALASLKALPMGPRNALARNRVGGRMMDDLMAKCGYTADQAQQAWWDVREHAHLLMLCEAGATIIC